MKTERVTTFLLLAATLMGCSSKPAGPYGYTAAYLDERSRCEAASIPDSNQINRFIRFYDQLKNEPIEAQINQVYADDIYFNDTLITLHGRDALTSHLLGTAERLDTMSVTLLDVLQSSPLGTTAEGRQPNATFLVWEMEVTFRLMGKDRLSHTLGISQLCFNDEGQVTFHQDFWDSSQGLDQHLPLLGPPTRWLRTHSDTH